MKVSQINQVNEALIVLRHFIDLSAKLLPFLEELNNVKEPNEIQSVNKLRIIEVYDNHNFDTDTSKMLLNSNILELIKNSFDSLTSKKRNKKRSLNLFLKEYQRLTLNWIQVDAN